MIEISPVLARDYDPGSQPTASNIATNEAKEIDSRRYTKFDRTASEVGEASMSFDDFLDMVNPLQHIPVVSSVYRAVTDEKINPVSRVVGDMLYGGPLGIASALVGGVGGVADAMMEAQNGKDVAGTVMASLFGDDASAASPAAPDVASKPIMLAEAPSPEKPDSAATVQSDALPPVASATTDDKTTKTMAPELAAAQHPLNQGKVFPLHHEKQAFGGVMEPVRAMAHDRPTLPTATGATRIGSTIYTNRLMGGAKPIPPAPVTASLPPKTLAADATAKAIAQISTLPSAASLNLDTVKAGESSTDMAGDKEAGTPLTMLPSGLPSNLSNDAYILRALGAYQNTASFGNRTNNDLAVAN